MLPAATLVLGIALGALMQDSFDLLFHVDAWLRRLGERLKKVWPWSR